MNRQELLKKLEVMLDDAAKTRQYGSIELMLQNGEVVLIKESRNTKIFSNEGASHYARRQENR